MSRLENVKVRSSKRSKHYQMLNRKCFLMARSDRTEKVQSAENTPPAQVQYRVAVYFILISPVYRDRITATVTSRLSKDCSPLAPLVLQVSQKCRVLQRSPLQKQVLASP